MADLCARAQCTKHLDEVDAAGHVRVAVLAPKGANPQDMHSAVFCSTFCRELVRNKARSPSDSDDESETNPPVENFFVYVADEYPSLVPNYELHE